MKVWETQSISETQISLLIIFLMLPAILIENATFCDDCTPYYPTFQSNMYFILRWKD
jgi:hypothetical protein